VLPHLKVDISDSLLDHVEVNPSASPGAIMSYLVINNSSSMKGIPFAHKKGAFLFTAVKTLRELFPLIKAGRMREVKFPSTMGGREKINKFSVDDITNGNLKHVRSRPILMQDMILMLLSGLIMQQ